MKKTTVLKRMIENNEFFVLPGGGCALHAKIAEAVGFKVAYMSGMNACATVFGVPDAGLLTLTEMVENAGPSFENGCSRMLVCRTRICRSHRPAELSLSEKGKLAKETNLRI